MRTLNLVRIATAAALQLLFVTAFAGVVPNTISEAFTALDSQLSESQRSEFAGKTEELATVEAHFGVGMYIRNTWFRGGSKLVGQLKAYGAQSFDDMSSMLLSAYWRHLNGKPFDLERQGQCYRRWSEEQRRLVEEARARGESSYGTPSFSCVGA